jgi:poly-gamma-glutamate synthesis protein (capsule biosynthesis protein)
VEPAENTPVGPPSFDPRRYEPDIKPNFRTGRQKRVVILLVLVLLAAVAAGYYILSGRNRPAPNESVTSADSQPAGEPQDPTIRMLATGDWIAHDAINLQAERGEGNWDYATMLELFRPYFSESDINFCNQATLAGGIAYGISGYPIFNAPKEWIRDMKGTGCNLINTGTNHTNDKGQAPIDAQADEWDKQAVLAVAGANRSNEEQQAVRYFERDGVRFAFLSYSTYSNAPNPNPYSLNRFVPELYEPQLKEANEKADIIIVSMRWGTEYSSDINKAQESAAQTLTDLGADIILGHGPHVLQPVTRLTRPDGTQSIAWYSLGNFLNAQLETEALTGCVATFSIDRATKQLLDSTCLPFYQHYDWTAEEKAAENLLARRNFKIMPLYKAQEYLSKSQLNTTVDAQLQRIQDLVNRYTKVTVRTSDGI